MSSLSNRGRRLSAQLAGAVLAASLASSASAHGFGQRFDLPLPLWFWVTGAGLTIVLTFGAIALFAGERRFDLSAWQVDLLRLPVVRALTSRWVLGVLRVAAVFVFLLSVAAGVFGAQDAYANLIVTIVWVIWWVGFAFVCALVCDLWAPLSPLRTLFVWAEALYARLSGGRRLSRHWPYPKWLGASPAVLLFLAFAWSELLWADKDTPYSLGCAVAGYAVLTWIGMFAFGRETWLRNGEAFAVAFSVLGRFAPLDLRMSSDGRGQRALRLRPFGAGLLDDDQPVRWSLLVFVLLMLSTVTFDGFHETPLMQTVEMASQSSRFAIELLFDLSEWGLDETTVVYSVTLLAFPVLFVLAFWLTSLCMMRLLRRWPASGPRIGQHIGVRRAACAFVMSLVPIAVAYHLSHYFSLLATAGQFVIPLASDPFGFGWNLFGTKGYQVDLAILSPYVYWYGSVVIIVLGHVIAVAAAHVTALRLFGTHQRALVSQLPMLLLMVAYTTLSLWILAQPIVG